MKQSAASHAKHLGCKSLVEVSRISTVPVRTLQDWYRVRRELFVVTCLGSLTAKVPEADDQRDRECLISDQDREHFDADRADRIRDLQDRGRV